MQRKSWMQIGTAVVRVQWVICVVIAASFLFHFGNSQSQEEQYQPIDVMIDSDPPRKSFSSLSIPLGSIWCQGDWTVWLVGHQKADERPWCYRIDERRWEMSTTTQLDEKDELNLDTIDRHSCASVDVNSDGLPDIVCGVGAEKGTGLGYSELYLTQTDGSLVKIESGHGLQKYPSMRSRLMAVLKDRRGEPKFIFMGTKGVMREDGLPNDHRMYRISSRKSPFFTEVDSSTWRSTFEAVCAVVGDFNQDGIEDLIVCDKKGTPLMITQWSNSRGFDKVKLPNLPDTQYWRNVRTGDVNRDGRVDLIVVTLLPRSRQSELIIFPGIVESPFFDFTNAFFRMELKYSAPDVEVLDVNSDGILDLYVVQANQAKEEYCGSQYAQPWWGENGSIVPPADWVAPLDTAPDQLLIGTSDANNPFQVIEMNHSRPGCGFIAEKFDDRTMLLSQGTNNLPGNTLILQW